MYVYFWAHHIMYLSEDDFWAENNVTVEHFLAIPRIGNNNCTNLRPGERKKDDHVNLFFALWRISSSAYYLTVRLRIPWWRSPVRCPIVFWRDISQTHSISLPLSLTLALALLLVPKSTNWPCQMMVLARKVANIISRSLELCK